MAPVCRFRIRVVDTHHYVSLFTAQGIEQKWASRVKDLLDVEMAVNNGLSPYICEKNWCFEQLEKAAADFADFQHT